MGLVVSFAVAFVGWATYRRVESFDLLWLGMMSFAIAFLDFGHAMAFPGMPNFFGVTNTDGSIYFWIASRYTEICLLPAYRHFTSNTCRR